jgi:hypothetical protein
MILDLAAMEVTMTSRRDGQQQQCCPGFRACTHGHGIRGTPCPALWWLYTHEGQEPDTILLTVFLHYLVKDQAHLQKTLIKWHKSDRMTWSLSEEHAGPTQIWGKVVEPTVNPCTWVCAWSVTNQKWSYWSIPKEEHRYLQLRVPQLNLSLTFAGKGPLSLCSEHQLFNHCFV